MNYICIKSSATQCISVGAIVHAIPVKLKDVSSEFFKVIGVVKNGKVRSSYEMVGKQYPVIGGIWVWEAVEGLNVVPPTKRQKRKLKRAIHG